MKNKEENGQTNSMQEKNYSLKKLSSQILQHEYTVYILYSVIIGLVVGFAAVLFHDSIEFFNYVFFKQTANGLYFLGGAAVIALPAIGMLIQSIMIYAAPKYASKKGVSEVIKAVAVKGSKIPFRTTIFHFLAPIISIGSGNPVGPEGPIARLGGGIANKLAYIFKLPHNKIRVLTAAGSGAAIAAIFNSPLGGIFFALEIILLNEFSANTFPALIFATVTSSAVARAFLGNKSVFIFHSPNVGSYIFLYHYALLGILAGAVSFLFVRYSDLLDKIFHNKLFKVFPQWIIMTTVGLLVGICGYFYKYLFGIGYNGINQVLSNSLAWQVVFVLFVLKFLLVPLVLNSGGFGGIFAPSLFIGACLGYLYGYGLNYFWGYHFDVTAFVLVSMGAVLGGINFIPISSILIIFEMTKDYSFILPLMVAVITSTLFVQTMLKKSTYERYLEQQGYRLSSKKEFSFLKSVLVKQVMRNDIVTILEETPLPEIVKRLMESSHNTFYTVNKDGQLTGTITEAQLRPIITEYEHLKEVLVARDIASTSIIKIKENDSLEEIMKKFDVFDSDEFPVVSSNDDKKVLGTICRSDVISALNKESLRTELIEQFSFDLLTLPKLKKKEVFDGYSIIERVVPQEFVGKTLAQLEFRNNYELEVLMIRKNNLSVSENENLVFPNPSYFIEEGDVLILFGKNENIAKAEQWQ